ncbi:hypothetical protein QAD02_016409, partial [Eretmocerus hayati]
ASRCMSIFEMKLLALYGICASIKYASTDETTTVASTAISGSSTQDCMSILEDLAEYVVLQHPNRVLSLYQSEHVFSSHSREVNENGANIPETHQLPTYEPELSSCTSSNPSSESPGNTSESQHRRSRGRISYDPSSCSAPGNSSARKKSRFRISETETNNEVFPSQSCDTSFNCKSDLGKHSKVHQDSGRLPCSKCDGTFKNKFSLERHVKNIHDGGKYYECSNCGKGFSREIVFKNHVRNHKTSISCELCSRRFDKQGDFENHMKTHMNEEIDRSCTKKQVKKSASKGKVYSCEECKKVLKNKYILKDHMRTHSSEKPIVCTICGRQFRDSKSMSAHRKSHDTKEKTLICSICGSSFCREKSLRRHHVLRHSNEKSISCYICDQLFNRRSDFEKHLDLHDGEKPFTCEICRDVKFVRECNWVEHMQIVHGNPTPSTSSWYLGYGANLEDSLMIPELQLTDVPSENPADLCDSVNQETHADGESYLTSPSPEAVTQDPSHDKTFEEFLDAQLENCDTFLPDDCSETEIERAVQCVIRLNRGSRD